MVLSRTFINQEENMSGILVEYIFCCQKISTVDIFGVGKSPSDRTGMECTMGGLDTTETSVKERWLK